MFASLIYAYGVFWLAVISPGPDFAVTVQTSVQLGRRAGYFCALGVALANAFHLSYITLGLGSLILHSPVAYRAIQVVAALYLIYLGVSAIRAKPTPETALEAGLDLSAPKASSRQNPFVRGFLINLANPKAIIFWMSYLSLVFSDPVPGLLRFGFMGLLVLSVFVWFSVVAYLLSQRVVRRSFLQKERIFNVAMGVLLAGLGLKVLMQI
jgi:threonine/homoserine/homoserine lactone efflux protein